MSLFLFSCKVFHSFSLVFILSLIYHISIGTNILIKSLNTNATKQHAKVSQRLPTKSFKGFRLSFTNVFRYDSRPCLAMVRRYRAFINLIIII